MKKIFIKASGDVLPLDTFHDFVKEQSENGEVVVCVGGGIQINQMFTEKGYPVQYDDTHGRITESNEQRQFAREILQKLREQVQEDFKDEELEVISPLLPIGGVMCDVNADLMIDVAYLAFDELYILTLKDRVEKKEEQFKEYEKVKVIGM